MLILAGNKAINFEQVFCLLVEKPRPLPQYLNASAKSEYLNASAKSEYLLAAYHSAIVDEDGFNSDYILVKRYSTQDEAVADLNKITAAYEMGVSCISLDTD